MVYKNALFELSGKSLAAAKHLQREIERELKIVAVQNSGPINEIQDSWIRLYTGLIARLEQEDPALLQMTGLKTPVVQVFKGKGTLPRAYREYPQIFLSPEKKPRYFAYCPVGYKGDYFKPDDAVEITDKSLEDNIGNLLFAGGWLGNAPIISIQKEGVATPADYVPVDYKAEFNEYAPPTSRHYKSFVAMGRSRDILKDYESRQQAYEAATGRVRDHLAAVTEEQFPEILKTLPPAEDVRAGVSISYGGNLKGKTQFIVSVRCAGNVNIMSGGKTMPLHDNPHYKFTPRHGGEYLARPRTDTKEGKVLARLMKAVPLTPAMSDYPEMYADYTFAPTQIESMLGVNGVVPQVQSLGGLTVLRYNCDDSVNSHYTPPGALPMSSELYNWLNSDNGDKNMGVTLPPMPQTLRREYETLIAAVNAKPSAAAPSAPAP